MRADPVSALPSAAAASGPVSCLLHASLTRLVVLQATPKTFPDPEITLSIMSAMVFR